MADNERSQDDELMNLNVDDLDIQELDEKLLDAVAGGTVDDDCTGYTPIQNNAC